MNPLTSAETTDLADSLAFCAACLRYPLPEFPPAMIAASLQDWAHRLDPAIAPRGDSNCCSNQTEATDPRWCS